MALPVKNFYGYIDGKNINTYKYGIDYSVKTLDGRLEKVREILNIELVDGVEFSKDEFWNVIFDQTFDEKLSKDGLYYVEEIDEMLPYKEFISWCKNNEIDPVEYLEITNPFQTIGNGDDVGVWEYTSQNTSKVKLVLTKNDGLYSDTNICKVLSEMCEYILKKTKRNKSTKYYFYTIDELKRLEKNDEKINEKFKIADEKGMMLFFKDISINYKFEKKQCIDIDNEEDLNTPYLKDYILLLRESKDKLSTLTRCDKYFAEKNKREDEGLSYGETDLMNEFGIDEISLDIYKTWNSKRRYLRKLCESIPSDAILTKDCIRGTIYFKSPLRDEGTPDWDMIDFFDKNHVKALIGMKRGNDLQNDLNCIIMDLENLIKDTSLTERQKEVLDLWKQDKSQTEIAEILGINQSTIHSSMDKIANNIVKKYEEQYENWYYLNIRKGKYKKCSKCGEIKLISRFNKNGKRGYMSMCKACR